MCGSRTDRVRTQRERIRPCIAPSLCVFMRGLRLCPVFCGKKPSEKGSFLVQRAFLTVIYRFKDLKDRECCRGSQNHNLRRFSSKNGQFRTELPMCCTILLCCALSAKDFARMSRKMSSLSRALLRRGCDCPPSEDGAFLRRFPHEPPRSAFRTNRFPSWDGAEDS